jgi:hypothetical protein
MKMLFGDTFADWGRSVLVPEAVNDGTKVQHG